MKLIFALLSILTLTITTVSGCINETRISLTGEKRVKSHPTSIPEGTNFELYKEGYQKDLHVLDSLWKKNHKIEDYSDYGTVLVYLGQYKKALKVFQEIEAKKPGLYATASNMGTVNELLGNNVLAYKWIKKAIKIDPKSHKNSEWLHLKILEVKIKGNQYLNSEFLIGQNFGKDTLPKSKLNRDELRQLELQIYYQLEERISFIKPKEKIVALLLFELGNICALTEDATTSYKIYKKAEEYGYSSELFQIRYEFVKQLQSQIDPSLKKLKVLKQTSKINSNKNKIFNITILGILSGLVILLGLVIWKKKKKQNR